LAVAGRDFVRVIVEPLLSSPSRKLDVQITAGVATTGTQPAQPQSVILRLQCALADSKDEDFHCVADCLQTLEYALKCSALYGFSEKKERKAQRNASAAVSQTTAEPRAGDSATGAVPAGASAAEGNGSKRPSVVETKPRISAASLFFRIVGAVVWDDVSRLLVSKLLRPRMPVRFLLWVALTDKCC